MGCVNLTYVYRCSNKKCKSIKEGGLQLNTGWKSSCCNLCDVPECPDHGKCECWNKYEKHITESIEIDTLIEYHKNNNIEVETFE